MNAQVFMHTADHYADWASAAKSMSIQDYRGRLYAVRKWLKGTETTAGANMRPLVRLAREAYDREIANLPAGPAEPSIPDLPPIPSDQLPDIAQKGRDAVALLKLFARKMPEREANDLLYCLNATRGNRVPGSDVDFDHLFAFFFKGVILATNPWDEPALLQIIPSFADWLEKTPINPGFEKEALAVRLLRLLGIEDDPDPPNSPPPAPGPVVLAIKVCRAARAYWNVIDRSLRLCGFGSISQEFRSASETMGSVKIF